MEGLAAQGKLRYYGASNYKAERLAAAWKYAKRSGIQGFSAVSNQWSPLRKNPAHVSGDPTLVKFTDQLEFPLFRKTGMSFVPYHITAGGYLAKKAAGTLTQAQAALHDNCHNN